MRARRAGSRTSTPQSGHSGSPAASAFSSVPTSAYMTPDHTPRKEPATRPGSGGSTGPSPLRPLGFESPRQQRANSQDSWHEPASEQQPWSGRGQADASSSSSSVAGDDSHQAAAFQSVHGGSQRGSEQPLAVSPLQAARASADSPSAAGRDVQAEQVQTEHSSPTMYSNPVHAEHSQSSMQGSPEQAGRVSLPSTFISNDAFSPEASKGSLTSSKGRDAAGSAGQALHGSEHQRGASEPQHSAVHADAGHISSHAARSPHSSPTSKLSSVKTTTALPAATNPTTSTASANGAKPSPSSLQQRSPAQPLPAKPGLPSSPRDPDNVFARGQPTAPRAAVPLDAQGTAGPASAAASRYRRAAKPEAAAASEGLSSSAAPSLSSTTRHALPLYSFIPRSDLVQPLLALWPPMWPISLMPG